MNASSPRRSGRSPVSRFELRTAHRGGRSPRLGARAACGLLLLAMGLPAQTAWTNRTPAVSPGARSSPGLAYDPVRGRTVMFGGVAPSQATYTDTWEWDGSTWQQRNVPG